MISHQTFQIIISRLSKINNQRMVTQVIKIRMIANKTNNNLKILENKNLKAPLIQMIVSKKIHQIKAIMNQMTINHWVIRALLAILTKLVVMIRINKTHRFLIKMMPKILKRKKRSKANQETNQRRFQRLKTEEKSTILLSSLTQSQRNGPSLLSQLVKSKRQL